MKRTLTILAAMIGLSTSTTYAQTHSVLSEGEWWKIEVKNSGIYSLTAADIPALEGVEIRNIGMYGGEGRMLPTENQLAPTTDLSPINIEVMDANGDGLFSSADRIIFYGEGIDTWRYIDGDRRWEMERHAYASSNFYFLCTTAPQAKRIAPRACPEAEGEESVYTAVAVHNNDITNIFRTGQLWMGEKFTPTLNSRSFTLTLPNTASDIRLRYALASKSSMPATFRLTALNLENEIQIAASAVYVSTLETYSRSAQSIIFNLEYSPGESTAEGYLDFIELNGVVPLNLDGGQTMVRTDNNAYATTRFRPNRAPSGFRVWEVSQSGAEYEVPTEGGTWTDYTDTPHQYIVFDGTLWQRPASVSRLPKQDLHGSPAAEYIVVCHPLFATQAGRLATLHAVQDGMQTLVVTDQEVYNEFSSGKQDPMAIRSFMRYLREKYPSTPPRYLLLFGKATYDPRDLLENHLPTVVTYQTPFSFDDDGLSYSSDDMMGYLDPLESGGATQSLDMGIGRLPAKNIEEARFLVDKIVGYINRSDLDGGEAQGNWRNYVALLSDDADPTRIGDTTFVHSSEATALRIRELYPDLNIDRLYADAYQQQTGAIGSFYPELKKALTKRINSGCLLLNYIGHGSLNYIGGERYIETRDISSYTNRGRLPLLVTSTCSYGYHDLPEEICGAEAFLLAEGGAVAVVSSTRPISHVEKFNTDVVLFALDTANTIGDAVRLAKNRTAVSACIGILGDPAMRLSRPQNRVVVTQVDNHDVQPDQADTATVLSYVTIKGEIRTPDGQRIEDFDGTIYPIVFDREMPGRTLANDNRGSEVDFIQQKSVLYKGAESVSEGRFEYTFMVPKDVAYEFAPSKLSHYAVSGTDHASGYYLNLYLGGLNEEAELGETRPEIELYLGDENFRDGGICDPSPTLIVRLRDSVGINSFGSGLGHDITLTMDGYAGSLTVLNDFYEADIADSRNGTIHYPLEDLNEGSHTIVLKAWNIWGYSNTASLTFSVRDGDTARFSAMQVWPNPTTGPTTFHYETSNASAISSAQLQIYSPEGALVFTVEPEVSEESYVVGPIRCDLSDRRPGVYVARILVTTDDGRTHQSAAKVIVR